MKVCSNREDVLVKRVVTQKDDCCELHIYVHIFFIGYFSLDLEQ